MSFFSKLFKKSPQRTSPTSHVHGGDGMSEYSPAIVDCSSPSLANRLIDRFITERCGNDWERDMEMTIKNPKNQSKSLRLICVKKSGGEIANFYFDLSKSIDGAMRIAGLR